jgi:hypothetical protein
VAPLSRPGISGLWASSHLGRNVIDGGPVVTQRRAHGKADRTKFPPAAWSDAREQEVTPADFSFNFTCRWARIAWRWLPEVTGCARCARAGM